MHYDAYTGNDLESYKRLIGQKIQKRRVEVGFRNQALLASKVGTDQATVSRWESGAHLPEGALKRALSSALDVNEEFFELIEVHPPARSKESLLGAITARLAAMDEDELSAVSSLIDGLMSSKGSSG